MTNLSKYKQDLVFLIENGEKLKTELQAEKANYFIENYQAWYSESLILVKNVLAHRYEDFEEYYSNKKMQMYEGNNRYSIKNCLNEELRVEANSDYPCDYLSPTIKNLVQQIAILRGCQKSFESSLFEIKKTLQADLFDSELDQARHLNDLGFVRAAGAVAGVVLEGHLAQVCQNHNLTLIPGKKSTISNYNEILKTGVVIEIDIFRRIQGLADTRNKCDHRKTKEPTKDEIEELILGVDKIIKNLF